MQIITTACQKGGCGKSTTAAALAQAAAAAGKAVLCVDMDGQGNLSAFVGADLARPGSFQLLHGTPAAQLIQRTEQGLECIVASPDLAAETTTRGSAKRLQEALKPIKRRYDYVFIDTPPHAGELLFNALQACTGLIIPLETDGSSLQGLYTIIDIAQQIRRSNRALRVLGTVITRYEARTRANQYMREEIADKGKAAGAPLLATIRKGTAIREAQLFRQSLYDYAPKSAPAADYMKLYEILQNS